MKKFFYTRITPHDLRAIKYSYPVSPIHQILEQRGFPMSTICHTGKDTGVQEGYFLIHEELKGHYGFACYHKSLTPKERNEAFKEHRDYWEFITKAGISPDDLPFEEWQVSELKKENERLKKHQMEMIERSVRPPMLMPGAVTWKTQYELDEEEKAGEYLGFPLWFWLFVAFVFGIVAGHFMKI